MDSNSVIAAVNLKSHILQSHIVLLLYKPIILASFAKGISAAQQVFAVNDPPSSNSNA